MDDQPELLSAPTTAETKHTIEVPSPPAKSDAEENYQGKLRPKKTIRLAVSGPVMISQTERKVIDTAAFQRLRYIRQLGMTYLVYPTATHTRFEHSLGTLQMVTEMIRAVSDNQHSDDDERSISAYEETLARLYALLHDVTHIPFGHSVEDELCLLTRHDENDDRIDFFLGPQSEIGQIISSEYGEEFLQDLLAIYTWDDDERARTHRHVRDEAGAVHEVERPKRKPLNPELLYIHDLISNTLCADLLDYLRRDRAACDFVAPREYWFLNFLYIHHDPETKQRRLCLRLWKGGSHGQDGAGIPRRDLLSDMCGLLQERYKLAERVYFHHAKIIATAMIGRAIQEATEAGVVSEEQMRHYGDDTLRHALKAHGNTVAKTLMIALDRRELHQHLDQLTDSELTSVQNLQGARKVSEVAEKIVTTPAHRLALENEIAEFINCNPGDILIYAPSKDMNQKVAKMKVLHNGGVKTLEEIGDPIVSGQLELTRKAHCALWSIQLLAKRGLSDGAIRDAVELFKAELLSGPTARERELRDLQTRKIRHELKKLRSQPLELAEIDRGIEAVRNQVFGLNKANSKASRSGRSLNDAILEGLKAAFESREPETEKN